MTDTLAPVNWEKSYSLNPPAHREISKTENPEDRQEVVPSSLQPVANSMLLTEELPVRNSMLLSEELPIEWPLWSKLVIDLLVETAREEGFIDDPKFVKAFDKFYKLPWQLVRDLSYPSVDWEPEDGIELSWRPERLMRLSITILPDDTPILILARAKTMTGESLELTEDNENRIREILQEVLSLQTSQRSNQ